MFGIVTHLYSSIFFIVGFFKKQLQSLKRLPSPLIAIFAMSNLYIIISCDKVDSDDPKSHCVITVFYYGLKHPHILQLKANNTIID